MSYRVPLSQLILTVRQRCDIVSNQVLTDPEITQNINDSGTELQDLKLSAYGSGYEAKQCAFNTPAGQTQPNQLAIPLAYEITLTNNAPAGWAPSMAIKFVTTGNTATVRGVSHAVVSGVTTYTLQLSDLSWAPNATTATGLGLGILVGEQVVDVQTNGSTAIGTYASNNGGIGAADFQLLRGLDVQLSGGIYTPVQEYKLSERAMYQVPAAYQAAFGTPFAYRLQGSFVVFSPAPVSGYACILYYAPTWVPLVNTYDTMDSIDGWHELIVLDGCIKAQLKQDLDASNFMQQKMAILARIEKMKANRDASAPARIVDIYETNSTRRFTTRGRYGW